MVESTDERSPTATEIAAAARRQLGALTGRDSESVVGLQQTEDGWRLLLEVVEVARVPASTDLIGVYDLTLDKDGQLLEYERVSRYVRSQAGEVVT